jgi:hypothetical protein
MRWQNSVVVGEPAIGLWSNTSIRIITDALTKEIRGLGSKNRPPNGGRKAAERVDAAPVKAVDRPCYLRNQLMLCHWAGWAL